MDVYSRPSLTQVGSFGALTLGKNSGNAHDGGIPPYHLERLRD